MKKSLMLLVSVLMVLSVILSACAPAAPTAAPAAGAPAAAGAKIVGISMPTKTSTRWISDGNSMVKSFEALGYKTDLQFADNDIQNQLSQLENMVTKGANVLVIAAIDGSTMSDVLQKAHDKGVLVISYDRLITKTPNVDYYATFDNFGVGVIQGTQLVTGLGLKDGKTGPFNVELFGGSPDDTNAGYFYNGAMSVIQPYIDKKQIIIQSGQMGMDKVGTLRWLAATAQARMDNLLSAYYTDKHVDGVLSPYDGLSIGILSSLKGVGYCTASLPCPVVTGQDAEVASVKSIIAGEQRYTVFKDTRLLAAQTAKMVDQALKGQTVDVNDTKTYNNGVKVVPSFLLTPISIDINNYKKELVDTGYIKAEDLGAAPAAPAATAAPAAAAGGGQASCAPNCAYKDMTLCFPQLGAESDWRTADTASFKETAASLGIKQLVFSDAQQKQENQISAVRACIQQGVNVIALPPVVETGWDAVLQEAKDANIPVIIVDRSVSADPSMYAAHIGSDMELEGKKAGEAMNKLLPNGGNILELSGTTGSGAAVGRAKGFRETLNANIKILDSQTGNFTRAEGKPVMEAFLKKYAGQVQGVFIHNDDMAIGAIEAIKAAGLKPGDLKIVSVDGTRGGFQAMVDGWIQTDVECNPLLGPQVLEMALKLMNGQPVDKNVLTNETVYYPDNAAQLLPTRKY